MNHSISRTTRRRLDIQGFTEVKNEALAEVGAWLRFAFGLCTFLALLGTVFASPVILWALVPVAALGALTPVHPFDHLYNYAIRPKTGTIKLPRRGAPSRFACGVATFWLAATAVLFQMGATAGGYWLGGTLCAIGTLVSTTDICIPSIIYRSLFGFPEKRNTDIDQAGKECISC